MNTNTLKKFAQDARLKLLSLVAAKLEYVLNTDTPALREKSEQIKNLQEAIASSSKEKVIDKVTYTWFNRFMALRFMDANNYQPIGIRVLSPKDGYTLPELLDEAKQENIADELKLNRKRVFDLLDGKIPSANPQNEAYKELLIAACNHLHQVFPFLFERINDYTELLLPDDLTSELSIVQDIRDGMTIEDCAEVEIIGWLYQFYISEKKDEIFASNAAVKKEDIPAATQLFTPRWIVEYMVQNTVGKLWLQNKPSSKLREHMPYFIESSSVTADDYLKIGSVEEIKLLDQACGSGHILVYGFELLYKIYEEEGYNPNEIPELIISKNLFGFEIDERASQLAGMALMLKARSYYRRFFRKEVKPNIVCFKDLELDTNLLIDTLIAAEIPVINEEAWDYFEFELGTTLFITVLNDCGIYIDKYAHRVIDSKKTTQLRIKNEWPVFKLRDLLEFGLPTIQNLLDQLKKLGVPFKINSLIALNHTEQSLAKKFSGYAIFTKIYGDFIYMQQATNLGTLIAPKTPLPELQQLYDNITAKLDSADLFLQNQFHQLLGALEQMIPLANKYACVVDNPPYMGEGSMNKLLGNFVKESYPDSKADLMACFMEAGINMLLPKGFLGMINQHSWMFLSSYEKLRKKLIENIQFDTLLHLGPRTFPEIGGEVVQNASFTFVNDQPKYESTFIRLVDYGSPDLKRTKTLETIQNPKCRWIYNNDQKKFEKIPGSPIAFWASKKFVSLFIENNLAENYLWADGKNVTSNSSRFIRFYWEIDNLKRRNEENKTRDDFKWVNLSKGGPYRRWYGNLSNIIDWSKETRQYYRKYNIARIIPENQWYKEGISWTKISSGSLTAFRFFPEDGTFDDSGLTVFFSEENLKYRWYFLGILNSRIFENINSFLNQTLNLLLKDVRNLPIKFTDDEQLNSISLIVQDCVEIAKNDWSKYEEGWDFTINHLYYFKDAYDLEETYDLFQHYWKKKFFQLHRNEEELNRQFIEIYGLRDELTPNIPLKDITILKEETSIENGQLIFHADEVFAQFISYAVGCMFGRYSLDKEGLILANQSETLENYLMRVGLTKDKLNFVPDGDNIIPVLDDEWFEDDIVGRFHAFLKASFGTANFEKNLAFVEECLGKDVRKYFVKDFYTDHIKRYKKRPIYWMFSSPKGSFNVLVYMHRYTPDTLNKIMNQYLIEYREKMNTRIEHLDHLIVSGSSAEQTRASKEKDKIRVVILELQEYEREILRPLAIERIKIDLDEGVLVNYNKFGKAIKEVAGLNDKVTKKKVKEFDWINTAEIQ